MNPASRRTDIDWLRIAATYLLFAFHVGKVFDPAPFFHIRSDELWFGFTVFCGFIGLWHMPLFFLLAGWSAAASLQSRGVGGFLRERGRRLGIPLLFACVAFGPIMKYAELSSGLDLNHRTLRIAPELQESIRTLIPRGLEEAPPFHETFLEFLPTFFSDLDRFTWGHLWFVAYLLAMTAALLPVFRWMLAGRGSIVRARTWMLYVPLAILAVVQLTMRESYPGIYNLYDDWANLCYYATFVASGFVLATQPALEELVERRWKLNLTIALAATLVLFAGLLGAFQSKTLMLVGPAVAGWCFNLAFLGLGRRTLTYKGPILDYLAESAFPVYVLHQVAIIATGYWLIRLPMNIFVEFFLLIVVSVAATLTVYHYVVRPFEVSRILFGMKRGTPRAPQTATAALARQHMRA